MLATMAGEMPTLGEVFDAENGVLLDRAGEPVELTPLECRVLVALRTRAGEPCSRDYLVRSVWPGESAPASAYERALNRAVDRVRAKLARAGYNPKAVRARVMWGYVLDVEKL